MDHVPQPEELRRAELAREKVAEERRLLRRRRFVKRWIYVSAIVGFFAAINNYFDINYACIAHVLFCSASGYALLRFQRGHLSGMILIGIGNGVISLIVGQLNPFGLIGFCVAGAIIGMGIRVEVDLQ